MYKNVYGLQSNMNPKVSVIITTYNRRNLLPYAIQSVLDQSYNNYEIVIVNDFGEDVWDIIQSFNSSKIIYLSHIKNLGLASARNTAIGAATGEYICYLDDDDLFLPAHLETVLNAAETEKKLFVYSDAAFIDEVVDGTKRTAIKRSTPWNDIEFSLPRLLVANYIPVNTWIHHASLFDKIGKFDESLNNHEDWDLLLRMVQATDILHVNQTTVEIRNRYSNPDNMLSYTQKNWYETYLKIYKRFPSNNLCIMKKRQQFIYLLSQEKMLNTSGKEKINMLFAYMMEKLKLRRLQIAFLYRYKCWDKEC